MALDAEKRIPDTTLPANSFKDGDILYGSDMNRVVDTLKTAVNENYKDLKGAVKGGDDIYIEPIEGVVDAEGQPIDTVDGIIKWLYDNKVLNEGDIQSLRINDLGQFEYYDGKSWNLATVGQQGDPGEGVPTGGLSGQFLRKQSDVSYDTEWVDAYDKGQVDTFIANLNNATRINLLKPTLQTQTLNGVTCTNNGGTYTVNGTATSDTVFWIGGCHLKYGKYKLLGTPNVKGCSMGGSISSNIGYNGVILEQEINGDLAIVVSSGTTMNNAIFKPMITTNLNATYDDFVSYEDSLATNKVIATRVNLLKPTLQTTTSNGVTCTNNGGTYTLNGTASSGTLFEVGKIKFNKTTTIKIVGCPKDGSTTKYDVILQKDGGDWQTFMDLGDGAVVTIDDTSCYYKYYIEIRANYTCNNLVFKPMLTTNLNATYDDFMSCLGTSWTQDTTNGYYTQNVTCSGITSKDNPTIDVVLSGTLAEMQSQQEEWGKILKVETLANTLKFYASEATTVSLSVMVKGV